jgi:hypothetical protein
MKRIGFPKKATSGGRSHQLSCLFTRGEIMRRIKSQPFVCLFFVLVAVSGLFFQSCQKTGIFLQEDLSLGVDEGDEKLIFGEISSICFDAEDNIHILDSRMWRIARFDSRGVSLESLAIPEGQGPGEISYPGEMAVSPQGKIFLFNFMERKILVLNQNGRAVNSFRLDIDGMGIESSGDETITVMGDKDGKLFHVYDIEGNPIRSYGEHFEVPQKLAEYNFPTVLYPQHFTVSESGRTYVYNPHKYEISVYRNGELEKIIKGSNEAFWPVSVKNGREVTLTFVSVFESKDRVYSFINSHGEVPPRLDVFEKDKQIDSLDVTGYACAVDSRGRLYCTVDEPFLRVIRYVIP